MYDTGVSRKMGIHHHFHGEIMIISPLSPFLLRLSQRCQASSFVEAELETDASPKDTSNPQSFTQNHESHLYLGSNRCAKHLILLRDSCYFLIRQWRIYIQRRRSNYQVTTYHPVNWHFDPAIFRGWKIAIHEKSVIFRVKLWVHQRLPGDFPAAMARVSTAPRPRLGATEVPEPRDIARRRFAAAPRLNRGWENLRPWGWKNGVFALENDTFYREVT